MQIYFSKGTCFHFVFCLLYVNVNEQIKKAKEKITDDSSFYGRHTILIIFNSKTKQHSHFINLHEEIEAKELTM